MSKTQLKKALSQLSAQQMAELLTDLYDARPEAREYLDFWVKPDIDAKLEKAKASVRKETRRQSKGRSRLRSTRLRRTIKDIASLNPGAEHVCEIMTFSVETACALDPSVWIKTSTQQALGRLLADTVSEADRAGMLDLFLPRIEKAVGAMKSSLLRPNPLKAVMKEALEEALDKC